MSLLSALVEESGKGLTEQVARELAASEDDSEILNRMREICEHAADHIGILKEKPIPNIYSGSYQN